MCICRIRCDRTLGEAIPFCFSSYQEDGAVVSQGMPEGSLEKGRYVGDPVRHHGSE